MPTAAASRLHDEAIDLARAVAILGMFVIRAGLILATSVPKLDDGCHRPHRRAWRYSSCVRGDAFLTPLILVDGRQLCAEPLVISPGGRDHPREHRSRRADRRELARAPEKPSSLPRPDPPTARVPIECLQRDQRRCVGCVNSGQQRTDDIRLWRYNRRVQNFWIRWSFDQSSIRGQSPRRIR